MRKGAPFCNTGHDLRICEHIPIKLSLHTFILHRENVFNISFISEFLRFVPDLEDIIPFDELVKDEGLSDETQEAAK